LTLDERLLRRQAQEAASRLDQANAETYASAATVRATGRNLLRRARMHWPRAAAKAQGDMRRMTARTA